MVDQDSVSDSGNGYVVFFDPKTKKGVKILRTGEVVIEGDLSSIDEASQLFWSLVKDHCVIVSEEKRAKEDKNTISILESEVKNLKVDIATIEELLKDIEEQRNSYKEKNYKLQEDLISHKDRLKEAGKEVDKLKQENRDLSNMYDSVSGSLRHIENILRSGNR